jgi:hypothetical protein
MELDVDYHIIDWPWILELTIEQLNRKFKGRIKFTIKFQSPKITPTPPAPVQIHLLLYL